MTNHFKLAALSFAVPGLLAACAPAFAAPAFDTSPVAYAGGAPADTWANDRRYRDRDYDRGYRGHDSYRYDDDRGYNNKRRWRDNRRDRCRRDDGTTGLIIGGAAGGLLGNEIAGRGDRTLGTILGVAGGALLGREIDRNGSRCR